MGREELKADLKKCTVNVLSTTKSNHQKEEEQVKPFSNSRILWCFRRKEPVAALTRGFGPKLDCEYGRTMTSRHISDEYLRSESISDKVIFALQWYIPK
jgi:hypothetical protein